MRTVASFLTEAKRMIFGKPDAWLRVNHTAKQIYWSMRRNGVGFDANYRSPKPDGEWFEVRCYPYAHDEKYYQMSVLGASQDRPTPGVPTRKGWFKGVSVTSPNLKKFPSRRLTTKELKLFNQLLASARRRMKNLGGVHRI